MTDGRKQTTTVHKIMRKHNTVDTLPTCLLCKISKRCVMILVSPTLHSNVQCGTFAASIVGGAVSFMLHQHDNLETNFQIICSNTNTSQNAMKLHIFADLKHDLISWVKSSSCQEMVLWINREGCFTIAYPCLFYFRHRYAHRYGQFAVIATSPCFTDSHTSFQRGLLSSNKNPHQEIGQCKKSHKMSRQKINSSTTHNYWR